MLARDAVGNRSAALARGESGVSEAKGPPFPRLGKSQKALRRGKVPGISQKVFTKASLPAPERLLHCGNARMGIFHVLWVCGARLSTT